MNPGWRKNYLRYKSYFLNVSASYRERTDVKVYLEILLSLFTIIVFSIFALRPTLLTIAQLIKDIETKKEILTHINRKLQNISSAQSVYDQNINLVRLLDSSVPPGPAFEVFARQVEGLISNDQLALESFDMGKVAIIGKDLPNQNVKDESQLPENAGALPFSLALTTGLTNYPQVYDFYSNLEKLRRPLKVDSLTITAVADQEEDDVNLLFIVIGRAPYLREGN